MTSETENKVTPEQYTARTKLYGTLTALTVSTLSWPYLLNESFRLYQKAGLHHLEAILQPSTKSEEISNLVCGLGPVVGTAAAATALIAFAGYQGGKAFYKFLDKKHNASYQRV